MAIGSVCFSVFALNTYLLHCTQSGTNFTINGVVFVPPSVPVLLQVLSGAADAASLLPSGSVYALQPNAVIELSIPAGGVGTPVSIFNLSERFSSFSRLQHPFHLHGHTFYVVRSAGNSSYNYVNPVSKCLLHL